MIVNPQLFNYKLIIGSLVIAIVVLGSYSLKSYSTLKGQEEIMEQEANLVQSELSRMINLYDYSRVDNQELALQLQYSKSKLSSTLDSLNLVKTDYPLISKYKDDITALIFERRNLFNRIASILEKNEALEEASETNLLKFQSNQLALAKLEAQNLKLTAFIDKISELALDKIEVKAIITNTNEYDVKTSKALDTDNLEVCFTVLKNEFTSEGNKDMYVQILGPDNRVVSTRGTATFGQDLLAYSGKTSVNYRNDNLDVCTKININQRKPLKKGDYLVSVFHDNVVLGSSKITLN